MNRNGPDERVPSVDEATLRSNQQWLEEQIPSLLPPPFAVAMQRYDRATTSLPEIADASLTNAVEKRRREFSAGRIAASAALQQLGVSPPPPISVGPARNPVWPAGFTGSITHTSGLAVAVVAATESITAVGIDLEVADAVQPELWPGILRPSEIDFVSGKSAKEQACYATLLFCAKESFYKMQYPLTGDWVDFQDAEIFFLGNDGGFELACNHPGVTSKLQRSRFAGRYLSSPAFSLTALWISREQMKLPAQ